MSMEGEILARLRKVEKALEVLLELHPEARARIEPHKGALTGCGTMFKPALGPDGSVYAVPMSDKEVQILRKSAQPPLPDYTFIGSGTVKNVRILR